MDAWVLEQAKALYTSGNLPDSVELTAGMTVTNPRRFIESHLSVIGHNSTHNRQTALHYERLKVFIYKIYHNGQHTAGNT